MKNTQDKFIGWADIDTTFVLFFLALEYGRAVQAFSMDGVLMGTTMAMVLVLPYFLPSRIERPQFSTWITGRIAVMVLAFVLGVAFGRATGVMIPQGLRFMPMTFLILASMVSCYLQFYSVLRLRTVK